MAKTVYEYLLDEKALCESMADGCRREMERLGQSDFFERLIAKNLNAAKAIELAAQNLPVEVAEKEI